MRKRFDTNIENSPDIPSPYITGYFFINLDFDKVNIDNHLKEILLNNMFDPSKKGLEIINKILCYSCTSIDYDCPNRDNRVDSYYITLNNMEFGNLDQKPCAIYRAYNTLLESNINFILDSYTINPCNKRIQFSKSFRVKASDTIDHYMSNDIDKVDKLILPLRFTVSHVLSMNDSYNRCLKHHQTMNPKLDIIKKDNKE